VTTHNRDAMKIGEKAIITASEGNVLIVKRKDKNTKAGMSNKVGGE
jgi:hypothetical protein